MDSFVLQIHITGNCNLRCKHCYLDEKPNELSVDRIEEILVQYKALIYMLQCRYGKLLRPFVNITGGEPFMHKQIYDVLDIMKKYSKIFSFRMMSNGTVLNDELIIKLKDTNIPCLQISIDGGKEQHDFIRGKGNLDEVKKGLQLLKKHSVETKVSFTAHSENYLSFSDVAAVCRECNVSTLWSDRYIPFDKCSELKPLSREQTKEYVELLQKEKNNPLNRKAKLQILNRRSLQFLCSGEYPYYCTAGISSMAVDDKGDVFPCRRLDKKCGNVFSQSLSEIYQSSPDFIELQKSTIPKECEMCRHASFCRGGAKCLSYSLFGSTEAKDPGCWL